MTRKPMTHLDRHTPTITACRFCPMCRHVCTVANATRWESTSPRGWALTAYALATEILSAEDVAASERLHQCAGCDRCYDDCVSSYRPSAAIRAARADLAAAGLSPEPALRVRQAIEAYGNPFGVSAPKSNTVNATGSPAAPSILFFQGCETRLRRPELADAFLQICEAAGVSVTVLDDEPCCGQPLHALGFWPEARQSAETLLQAIGRSVVAGGAAVLVFGCPSCQRQVTQVYREEYGLELPAGLQVMHTTQFVERLVEEHRIELRATGERTVTYHDPCSLGRAGMGIYDPPRHLLAALGYRIVEPRLAREHAVCCGSGTLHQTYPAIARKAAGDAVNHLLSCGAERLATACPSCKSAFGESEAMGDTPVLDIVELVAELL